MLTEQRARTTFKFTRGAWLHTAASNTKWHEDGLSLLSRLSFCILRRSSISFLALGGIALFVLQEKTAAGCGQPFSPPGGSWGWWWVPLKPRVRALVAHSRCWLSVSLSKFLARYFLACLIDWGGTVDRSDSCRKGDRTGITNASFCFCCLLSNWSFSSSCFFSRSLFLLHFRIQSSPFLRVSS